MKVTDVKINGIASPMGFHMDYVICSWKVSGTDSKNQADALIEVSTGKDFNTVLYTKKGKDLKQQGEKLDIVLEPRTAYYCRVKITGDKGDSAVSDAVCFETGK
ncbi:MAG TPA: hypothetical protein DCZ23_06245, partial [Lachnospiraceae bacterium]|nr:hypothetical protein [Lachnospiraceae bacterium]